MSSDVAEVGSSTSATLTVRDLSHWFIDQQSGNTVHALDGINLTIQPGEFVTVVGPSGCGKTTLLKILAGFIKPGRGEARVHGQLITKPGPERGPVSLWAGGRSTIAFRRDD